MHTHYHAKTQTFFTLEACEYCGADIIAPNAVKSPNAGELAGVTHVETLPGEAWYSDETGTEVCEKCDPEIVGEAE